MSNLNPSSKLSLRLLSFLALSGVLLWATPSHASPTFPQEIYEHLGMDCPPPCTICHTTQAGGGGTAVKPFVNAMLLPGGLIEGEPSTVASALDTVEASAAPVDSDGDGAPDIQELRDGRDPNVSAMSGDDALICGPAYGCGARVAAKPSLDGTGALAALCVGLWLTLRYRHRSAKREPTRKL